MKWYITAMLLSLLSFFMGCGSAKETVLYRGQCGERAIVFSVKEKAEFSTIRFWMEVQIDRLPLVKISSADINRYIPYDFSLLKGMDHRLYDTTEHSVQVPYFAKPLKKYRYLLFIDPATVTKPQFEAIDQCLRRHIEAMETALFTNYISARQHFNFPQLSGVVYGRADELTRDYYLSTNAQIYLNIPMDGNVGIIKKIGSDGREESGFGQAYRAYEGGTPATDSLLRELNQYVNPKTNRTLTDDFDIRTAMSESNRQKIILIKQKK